MYRYVTAEGLSVGMGGVYHRAYLENADNDQVERCPCVLLEILDSDRLSRLSDLYRPRMY